MNVDLIDDKLLGAWKMSKSFKAEIKKFGKDEEGGVVTRFPPAPSGFFHIGHAKALFINYVVSKIGNGKMLIRFDDTNPLKDEEDFETVILDDICDVLGVDKSDLKVSYTSDYFENIIEYADYLVQINQAYIDGSSGEMINFMRNRKMQSPYAKNEVETNVDLWEEMKKGNLSGAILRLTLDYKSPNGCLRDPTIFRTVDIPHNRTGNKFKVYPTYDFACPIVDSLEGVTHVFRSTEFTDRNPQYKQILQLLKLRCPQLNQYGKLVFKDAVLSKRKIGALIENGIVQGWDDPQLLTWRGAKRRGLSREGLIQFLSKVGITKSVVEMDQSSLWSINQKVIDKVSTRFIGLLEHLKGDLVDVTIKDKIEVLSKTIPRFNRNKDLGERTVHYSNELLMQREDLEGLTVNEEVTLVNWGNVIYLGNNEFRLNLEGDFKKTEKKLFWISKNHTTLVYLSKFKGIESLRYSERVWTESGISDLKEGDFVQFLRMNYYRVDKFREDNGHLSLIELPN